MKKKLKWILPLCLASLIAIGALTLFLRYRSAGDILLSTVFPTSNGTYLLQARETGARQIKLSKYNGAQITFSPNGRYFAFTHWKDGYKQYLLYDTQRPRRPVLRVDQPASALLPLDDGSLIFINTDHLYHATKGAITDLAEDIRYLGAVSGDGEAVYCFRPTEDNKLNLCRVALQDGSLTTLLEDVEHTTLQVVQDEAGQDIVVCAQMHTYEFTAYDLVHDPLAEADAASEDEAAVFRNSLRERLREKTLSDEVYTVYRIIGGKTQTLAEGIRKTYFCDPLTGMVVHCLGRLFTEPVDILTLREAYVPDDTAWYCSLQGTKTPLAELKGTLPTVPQFSRDGSLAILKDSVLYLWQTKNGVLGEAEVMADPAQDFALLRQEDGSSCLYYKTSSGLLRRHDGTQDFILSANVLSAHLPCRVLPDGTKQLIDDMVYVITYARTGLRRENLPPVTMSQMINIRPRATTLYLVAPNGVKTVVANISNNLLSPLAALSDGSILAESGPLYILGPGRTDRLSMRFASYSWSTSICTGTELVTLQ